jgi:hypothetical protein
MAMGLHWLQLSMDLVVQLVGVIVGEECGAQEQVLSSQDHQLQ